MYLQTQYKKLEATRSKPEGYKPKGGANRSAATLTTLNESIQSCSFQKNQANGLLQALSRTLKHKGGGMHAISTRLPP